MSQVDFYENQKIITAWNDNVDVQFVVEYSFYHDVELNHWELDSIDRIYVYRCGRVKDGVPNLRGVQKTIIDGEEYWERHREIDLDYIDEDFFISEIYRDGFFDDNIYFS